MNENIYDIDYATLSRWATPKRLRKDKFLRLLYALISPVVVLYQGFLLFRKAKLYHLMITPQKCYLERLLNDRYDFTERRIYIGDGQDKPPFYIFKEAELKPQYLKRASEAAPIYIYTNSESGAITDDFIVWVPVALVFEEPEMVSLIKIYKLAGTKFRIQRF